MNDPIGDAARSILDGHIVLSRRLASAGHFPTIEVLESRLPRRRRDHHPGPAGGRHRAPPPAGRLPRGQGPHRDRRLRAPARTRRSTGPSSSRDAIDAFLPAAAWRTSTAGHLGRLRPPARRRWRREEVQRSASGNVLKFRAMQEAEARAIMLQAERDAEVATAELDARLAAIGVARPFPARRTSAEFHERPRPARAPRARRRRRPHHRGELAGRDARRPAAEWEVTAKAVRALERLDDRHRATWVRRVDHGAAQAATDEVAQTHYDRNRG